MARWARQPNEKGLARVCQGPRGADLREKGEVVARVRKTQGGWYWYGLDLNSLTRKDGGLGTFPTIDAAKLDAMNFYKAQQATSNTPTTQTTLEGQ